MDMQLELEGFEQTKSQRLMNSPELRGYFAMKAGEFAQGIDDCDDTPACDCESCRAYYYDSDESDPPEQRRLFLTTAAYWVSRMYGGPEEGGWWWDSYTLLTEPHVFMESIVIPHGISDDEEFALRRRVRDRLMREVEEQAYSASEIALKDDKFYPLGEYMPYHKPRYC